MFSFSSRVSPPSKSQQTTTSTPCSIAVTRNITPIPTAKNTLNEGDKTLPIKAARRTLDTSRLKISAYHTDFFLLPVKVFKYGDFFFFFLKSFNQSHAPNAENLVQSLRYLGQCCKKIWNPQKLWTSMVVLKLFYKPKTIIVQRGWSKCLLTCPSRGKYQRSVFLFSTAFPCKRIPFLHSHITSIGHLCHLW